MAEYIGQQSVREEAGLQHEVLAESLGGTVDGSNRVFVTSFKPIVDRNYDGIVSTDDVIVYVNGLPVAISSINAVSGAITLTAAPVSGAVVTADYAYSPVKDQFLDDVLEEVQDIINERLEDITTVPFTTVPKTIRLVAKYWAAGLLLARDYGFNSDTDQTSKDGYKKIEKAGEWLDKYAQRIQDQKSEGPDVPEVESEGNLMSEVDSQGRIRPPTGEENFSFTSDVETDTGW